MSNEFLDSIINRAKEKIISILKKKYKIPDKDIEEVSKEVYERARSSMINTYTFDRIIIAGNVVQTLEVDKLFFDSRDFTNYHTLFVYVPYYQSLGDTLGFHNGNWEFNYGLKNPGPEYTNNLIAEFISLGGINDISITNWMASDDTIMYMATYRVLSEDIADINDFGSKLRLAYLDVFPLMSENRGLGEGIRRSLIRQKDMEWNELPYDSTEIGSGSSMRSGCIGLFFPGKHNRKRLIALAVECSRITHNSAIAILGSIVSALFTAYALERVAINHWPHKLKKLFNSGKIDEYMKKSRPSQYKYFERDKILFYGQWDNYINFRFTGTTPRMDIKIMKDPVLRFKQLSENFSKKNIDFPGGCADDSVIMAYDALLESGPSLEKLVVYSILHPGDSDTVGSIAMSWYGAMYHNYKQELLLGKRFENLEFNKQLQDIGDESREKITKTYFYDILVNTASKIMRKNYPVALV
jgi:ADP-ribosylglycohydrolase